jgi:hypothetical protein
MQLSKQDLENAENKIYDTLIVGGGAGGLSAGIYLQRFRLSSVIVDLTFPVIFLFERSLNFSLSQSLIFSSAIVIKSSLLETAKSLKPLFRRRFQT